MIHSAAVGALRNGNHAHLAIVHGPHSHSSVCQTASVIAIATVIPIIIKPLVIGALTIVRIAIAIDLLCKEKHAEMSERFLHFYFI